MAVLLLAEVCLRPRGQVQVLVQVLVLRPRGGGGLEWCPDEDPTATRVVLTRVLPLPRVLTRVRAATGAATGAAMGVDTGAATGADTGAAASRAAAFGGADNGTSAGKALGSGGTGNCGAGSS